MEPTPVADARARLPASAPLVSAVDALPATTRDVARSSNTANESGRKHTAGRKRNVRRRALLLLVVLAVAALAAAVGTGSLERWLPAGFLPAGFLPGTVVLPSAPGAGPALAVLPSLVAPATPTTEPSASPSLAASPTPLLSAAASPFTHVVQPGETLTLIAARYGVTAQAIRRANHLKDPNLIHVGEQLIIPPTN